MKSRRADSRVAMLLMGLWAGLNSLSNAQTTGQWVLSEVVTLQEWAAAHPVPEKTIPVVMSISDSPPGTWWSLQLTNQPPLPFCPFPELQTTEINSGIYVFDDRSIDYPGLWALQAAQAQVAAAKTPVKKAGSGTLNAAQPGLMNPMSNLSFSPTALQLEILAVSNNLAWLNLRNATNGVYEIWSRTGLATAAWDIEQEVWPGTNRSVMPFTVPLLNRTNSLFFWARDWTGIDENTNGIPDWWEWMYLGTLSLPASFDPDEDGQTILYDYQHGINPNILRFSSIDVTNSFFHTSPAPARLGVTGLPYYIAILVDDTNTANAVWDIFSSSNITVNLGTLQGWHSVWIGLRAHADSPALATWQWTQLKLDTTPPLLIVTNPAPGLITQPLIQMQGYCLEPLAGLSYDISNATGIFTNQKALILSQFYDVNVADFTTNYFQAFDVEVTNGINCITLHAVDLAGNATTTDFTFPVDYSGNTNPPAIYLFWPQNGTRISGNTFTWRGWVSNPTAQLIGQTVDPLGVTNSITGQVDRSGNFYIQNLPLMNGTNRVNLIATDIAGNSSSTNISVIQSAVVLTISSAGMGQFVSGTIDDPNYTVWVNGVKAINNGGGIWAVNNPNLSLAHPLVQARAIPNSDNGGNGSDDENSGNPDSSQAVDVQLPLASPDGVVYLRSQRWSQNESHFDLYGGHGEIVIANDYAWDEAAGGGGTSSYLYQFGISPYNYLIFWPSGGCWPALLDGTETPVSSGGGNPYDIATPPGSEGPYASYYSGALGISLPGPDFYNSQYAMQGQLSLVTGGQPGSTDIELYHLRGAAFRPVITPQYPVLGYISPAVPPEQIHSSLGNLDGSGDLWVALPSNTRVDPGMTVEGTGFSNPGMRVLGSSRAHIYFNGQDVTDANSTVVVGQKITLTCSMDGGLTGSNFQWTLPGYTLSNYVADDNAGKVYVDFDKTANPVTFSWVDGGFKQVQCSLTAMGQQLKAKATFTVIRPVATIKTTTGVISIDSSWGNLELHFGYPSDPGIEFSNSVSLPANWPIDMNYDLEWVQTMSTRTRMQTNDGSGDWYNVEFSNVLDTTYPYDDEDPATDDSPGTAPLHNIQHVVISDTFEMWLLFKPAGGQWVPLRKVNWNWTGEGTLSGTIWTLTRSSNSINPPDSDTTTYPVWNDNARFHNFEKE